MSRLLFASVHDTLFALLGDRHYLRARAGIITTLHTWSQTLLLHQHLHCLVSGGGLSETGHWVAVRNGFLLPMRVVIALFRGKLLAAIRQGFHQGQLTPPQGKSRQQMKNVLNQLGHTKCNVHIRESYPHGHGGLIYLARYLHGGPLADRCLRAGNGKPVVYRYAERAEGPGGQATQRTMRLPIAQFIGCWRQHVPPRGAVRVQGRALHAFPDLCRVWRRPRTGQTMGPPGGPPAWG